MLEHRMVVVRAETTRALTDVEEVKTWLRDLVSKLGMTVLMGPYGVYSDMVGNRGLTAMVIINTSHIALHAWDEEFPHMLQLDVYTCGELDLEVITTALQQFYPSHIDYKYLDRKSKFIEIL